MEAVGRLAGGIAHDFNNLLMPIMAYSQLILDRLPPNDELHRFADQVVTTAERAAALPRQLLAFSRRQVLQTQILSLNEVVGDMEKLLRRVIGEDIQLVTVLEPALSKVNADPGQIEQVIMNLVVNARDAMPEGGHLTLETANVIFDAAYARMHPGVKTGPYVMLAVSDTGCGMDRETQSRIFEPFFTTKERDKGTGLGLSTVYGIVTQSDGHVRVYSEVGRGTTFRIYLPRAEARGAAAETQHPTALPGSGTETILVVEDEETVRTSVREILRTYGYQVLDAPSGEAGLELLSSHNGTIHLLLTDAVLPGMPGRILAEQLTALRPETRILFMSGYADQAMSSLEWGAGSAFLQKPFSPSVLVAKVREVLDQAR
jgi:CheY-like chemotaxis protein